MRIRLVFVALVGGLATLAMPSSVDATASCPDGHMPAVAMSNADRQKDHNGNQVVCKRIAEDGTLSGGPDDSFDDPF
ncbi:MAG TPA: hypothetical protein VF230_14935 [Acidimicrobiales bacterium]